VLSLVSTAIRRGAVSVGQRNLGRLLEADSRSNGVRGWRVMPPDRRSGGTEATKFCGQHDGNDLTSVLRVLNVVAKHSYKMYSLHLVTRATDERKRVRDSPIGGTDLTQTAVLALLGLHGPTPRAAIARELDVSPATVTQVTKRLIEQGVLETLDYAPSNGGRPGQRLGLVGTAGRAVGVKVAADHLAIVDMRLDGQVISARTDPFDAVAPDVASRLALRLEPLVREEEAPLLGIGVAVPGIVNRPDVGQVETSVLGWSSTHLGRHLRGALGVPIIVENDVKALAVAERLYGQGRSRPDFVVVTIGRGIGFATVSGGTLRRGAHGGAGEIAHLVVEPDGPTCACGNRGCLEAFVGAEGLVEAARSSGLLAHSQGMRRLEELADKGHTEAGAIFARAGERLARAIAAPLTVIDPEVIFLAGEGTGAWHHWEQSFCSTLQRMLPPGMREVPVEVCSWDDTSWARGAAAIVLATPFDQHAPAGRQRRLVLARLHGDDGAVDEEAS
jgi:predicted NBD/HSP70 family sugar kinase